MKQIFMLILLAIVILTGCKNNKNDKYYDTLSEKIQKSDQLNNETKELSPSRQISMIVLMDPGVEVYKKYAKEYMLMHPEIEINIEYKNDFKLQNYADAIEDYRNHIYVELMSGNAPDIVDVGILPYTKIGESGMLYDLYEFMDQDKTFDKEDYYSNIFTALEYKNGLYMLPFTFSYNIVSQNSYMLDASEIQKSGGIPFKKMTKIYEKLNSTDQQNSFYPYNGFAPYFMIQEELPHYVNYETGEVNLNSDDFIWLLEQSKKIPVDTDNVIITPDIAGIYSFKDISLDDHKYERKYLYFIDQMNMDGFYKLIPYEQKIFIDSQPSATDNGEYTFSLTNAFGITKSSKEKNTAWDFLHYCVSEKDRDIELSKIVQKEDIALLFQGGNIPINKNNFFWSYQLYIDGVFNKRKNKISSTNIDNTKETIINTINDWNNKQSVYSNTDQEAYFLIYSELYAFYNNQLTSMQAAEEMQRKVEIYINE